MSDKPQALIHVVEDDAAVSRLIAATLERFGYRQAAFATGGDFLRQLLVEVPDLAILDLGLPDMDGMAILREIQARGQQVSVIVITSNASISTAIAAMREGAFDYIVKPFNAERLSTTVRNAMPGPVAEETTLALARDRRHGERWTFGIAG